MIAITLTGCSQQFKEIKQNTKQAKNEINDLSIESRDAKRVADANILNTTIQLYILDAETLPTIKDTDGNFKSLKLINNSSDFKQFEKLIKNNDPSMSIPTDPLDPDRYFEYYSDGKTYTIKTYLEQKNTNCTQTKPGYCEFVIEGNIDTVLN